MFIRKVMENIFFISNYDFTLHFVACAAQLLSFVALVLCAEHVYIQPYYYYYYYYTVTENTELYMCFATHPENTEI